jgi:predicted dehydrogenase
MISKHNKIDSVVITTPIHTHGQIILDLLKQRKDLNIFVEKPLAASYDEATSVCSALNGSLAVNMVGFQKRYAGTFRKAKELLSAGVIGNLSFFRSYSFMSDIFRKGQGWRFRKESGGVTLEVGPHIIDLLIWYFGMPGKVTGIKKMIYSEEVEDYVHANFEYQNGLFGYVDLSWSIRNYRLPEFYVEVHGSNGFLTVNDDAVSIQLDNDSNGLSAGTHVYRRPELQPSVPYLLGDPEFCVQDGEFRSAIVSKSGVETNFRSSAQVNYLMDKIRNL